jgi:hypothetical protein
MKTRWIALGLSMLTALASQSAGWCNSIDEIVNDMKGNHEALPKGVPAHYDWQARPRIGMGNNPSGANRLQFWIHVYEPTTGNSSSTGRVQIANAKLYYLRKDTNRWEKLQEDSNLQGASFPETYSGATKTGDTQAANPGISVRAGSKSTAGSGYMFHGWISWMATINPNNVAGVFSTFDARLIGDSNAKYIASAGADYKNQDWAVYGDAAIGKFKWVTSSWKSFNMHTLTESQIRQNPPPILGTGAVTLTVGSTYKIKASHSNRYVTVSGSSDSYNNGANIFQYDRYSDNGNQKFVIVDGSMGTYKFRAVHSNKMITVSGGSDTFNDGANIFQWDNYSDPGNQKWKLEDAGSGAVKIRALHSDKYLTVSGASDTNNNGANILQWSRYSDHGNQKFYFEKQ